MIKYILSRKKLLNLKCFMLNCDLIRNYNELILPLLHRMINLEEVSLNLTIVERKTFADDINLMDITNHMKQFKKFTFNICSTIPLNNQINLLSNEIIQKIFKNLKSNQIIFRVDYFSVMTKDRCHIYSYPYIWKKYDNINNFPGGLFYCVRQIMIFDERPFEHECFLQIAHHFH